jgi:Flp pilus assembly protein TadG
MPGQSRVGGDSGAVTLSYVIIVPVFLTAILVVVQASVLFLAKQTALAAARHGADVARTAKTPAGASAGAAAAIAFAKSAGPGFLTGVSATSGGTPATVKVTVSGQAFSVIPGTTFRVSEVVTAPVERFVTLGGSRLVRYDHVR